jgi:hypothetical protein
MCRITLETTLGKAEVEWTPRADFITCLIPALLAAVPAFLQSFMSCIAGGGSNTTYQPGDRVRCR